MKYIKSTGVVDDFLRPVLIDMKDEFYRDLPEYEDVVSDLNWKAETGKRGGRYVYRAGGYEKHNLFPKVLDQMLRYYGFKTVQAFCSMEEESQVGLSVHDDDSDVLGFNIHGTTSWWYESAIGSGRFHEAVVGPKTLIYMPRGVRHFVEVHGERLSVSFVRPSKRPKPVYDKKVEVIKQRGK